VVQNDIHNGQYGGPVYHCRVDRGENNTLGAHPQQLRNIQSTFEGPFIAFVTCLPDSLPQSTTSSVRQVCTALTAHCASQPVIDACALRDAPEHHTIRNAAVKLRSRHPKTPLSDHKLPQKLCHRVCIFTSINSPHKVPLIVQVSRRIC
jgi:hypothetical protein